MKDLIFITMLLLSVPPCFSQQQTNDYVLRYKDIAIKEMQRTGIPASITIAQGIKESYYGKSDLARLHNNHFGIKCHNWNGRTYYKKDDEIGKSCFRGYTTVDESFRDHSNFLLKSRYRELFFLHPTDYRSWAKGLQKCGYATDSNYAKGLIQLIEDLQLYQYDKTHPKLKKIQLKKQQKNSIHHRTNLADNQQYTLQKANRNYSAKRYKEALTHYEYLAKKGNTQAYYQLGLMYLKGQGINKSEDKAFFYLSQAAKRNSPKAQHQLGLCYEHGIGIDKDISNALFWYQQAARKFAISQNYLGNMYQYGRHVERNYKVAFFYYEKAAKQGLIIAQLNLADMHRRGFGTAKDPVLAAQWYRKVAETGDPVAQNTLAYFYKHGFGVQKDIQQSIHWYTLAAKQNYIFAQVSLGNIYFHGIGIDKDYSKAFELYQKAALKGNTTAQKILAYLYLNGLGIEKDQGKALYWYNKAKK